jgi:hypothetical protein
MAATATERHWLAAACLDPDAAEVSPTAWRGRIVAASGWSVATDGRAMAAVCDGGRLAEPGGSTPTAACGGVIASLITTAPPRDAVGVDLGDLAEWCKYPDTPCLDCKGTGKYDAQELPDYDCFRCDGEKLDPARNTLGWVRGGLFDRLTIRRGIAGPLADRMAVVWATPGPKPHPDRNPYPPGPAHDEWAKRDDYRCLILHAAGDLADGTPFHLAFMGVSHTPSDHLEEQHRFRPAYVPGVGALWHLIGSGGRGIVADWLMDRGLGIEAVDPLPF